MWDFVSNFQSKNNNFTIDNIKENYKSIRIL